MRIGYLPTAFEFNRNEASNISLRLLSENLSKDNEIFIFTGNIRNKKQIEKYKGITIVRLSKIYGTKNPKLIFYSFKAIFTHIFASSLSYKKFKRPYLDIIHGISSSPYLILRTLFTKTKAKKVHTLKSTSIIKSNNFFTKFLVNRLDAVIVLSEKYKRQLISIGVKKSKVHVIKSPIDSNKFKPRKIKKQNIILYYGHFNEFKGVKYLIKAMDYLPNNFNLFLIPSFDTHKDKYNKLIKRKNIKILHSDTDIVKYINQAKVVVLPYPSLVSTEANPSVMLESMACKTPVITSELPEIKEIVKHMDSALLTKPKNPKDIADKIKLIFKDKKLSKKITEKAYRLSKQFDTKLIADKHRDLYQKLIR